jgi:type II secretory pathway component GspD/PulD (secretin)
MKKLTFSLLAMVLLSSMSFAQDISIKANDTDVKAVLKQIFVQAKIKNYTIDPKIKDVFTGEFTEINFELAIKNICRQSSLTYSVQDSVWVIEPRKISYSPATPKVETLVVTEIPTVHREKIHLNYIDPYDLMAILGPFDYVYSFSRFRNINRGNTGGGGNNTPPPGNSSKGN